MSSRLACLLLSLLALAWSCLAAEPVPPELALALTSYRAEGGFGYAFTQTSVGSGQKRVETFDPSQRPAAQWTLVSIDDRAPTEKELREYRDHRAVQARGAPAPNVRDQLIRESCELVSEDAERARYRFRINPVNKDDTSAAHMQVTFTLHRPTGAIEEMELANFEEFSPVFGMKVKEAVTHVRYLLPDGEHPALLDRITTRVRGRAFGFKSLDSELTVTYSDYRRTVGLEAPSAQPTAN